MRSQHHEHHEHHEHHGHQHHEHHEHHGQNLDMGVDYVWVWVTYE